jgi:transposase
MGEFEAVVETVKPVRRRRHSKEFKAEVVRAAMQPNVSIAAVALHYRLNANMLRSWVATQEELDATEEARKLLPSPQAEFVPLQIAGQQQTGAAIPDIMIEVRRGSAVVSVRWPGVAAAECAAWMQGWLR